LRKRSFWSRVQNSAIWWLHFQFWLKAFDIALSPLASSAITMPCVTKSAPGPPHSSGTARVRKPRREPFRMISQSQGPNTAFDLIAGERLRAQLLPGELARLQLPAALLLVQ
jgi:hypothetical protein